MACSSGYPPRLYHGDDCSPTHFAGFKPWSNATAIKTLALADKLDQDPGAGNALPADLDFGLEVDVDLDPEISIFATLSSTLWQWTAEAVWSVINDCAYGLDEARRAEIK